MTPRYAAHLAQFFDSDAALVGGACQFIREGIEAGETCIALTTTAHHVAIATQLASCGLNADAMLCAYRYIAVDAQATLQRFLGDEGPDEQRFHRQMGTLIRQAGARGEPVRIFGELASLLLASGRHRCALRIEELWNELSRYHSFKLLCAFPQHAFSQHPARRRLLCAMHSAVVAPAD